MKVNTNQIKYELDTAQYSSLYDVFSLKTTEDRFPLGAKLIDELSANKHIISVIFVSRKEYLLLLKKKEDNKQELLTNIRKLKGGDKITLTEYFSGKANDYYLLQLLLNALGTRQTNFESYNNVTGHLYCFHPNWIKRNRSEIISIPTMDIRLTTGILTWDICTFNSMKYKNVMNFGRKSIYDFPHYTISANYSLRRKLNDDENKEAYIQRQIFSEKTSKPFLDISDEKSFEESKMGILAKMILLFNEKYKGLANIGFEQEEIVSSIEYSSSREKRLLNERISKLLSKQKVTLIDLVETEKSIRQCEQIVNIFKSTFGISIKKSKRLSKDAYNLRLIHNDEYYGNNSADPHDENLSNYTIQHLTTDNFNENGSDSYIRAIAFNVAEELLIKEDIKNKCISIVDWSEYKFDYDLIFGIEHDVLSEYGQKMKHFYFITIKPDGHFDICQQENTLFSSNEYHNYIKIFTSCTEESVRGIVKCNDSINIIHETGLHTVPNIFGIKEELVKGNNKLKNKTARDNYLSALLDVKTFKNNNNELYYFVGEMGAGINSTLSGVPIRKIETYENSILFFDKLLPLMGVTFVRNNQLTVIPFPFKYLREYISTKNSISG